MLNHFASAHQATFAYLHPLNWEVMTKYPNRFLDFFGNEKSFRNRFRSRIRRDRNDVALF